MKIYTVFGLLVAGLLMIPGLMTAEEADPSPYLEMSSHYEAIRLALLGDSLNSVDMHAKAIHQQAKKLAEQTSPAKVGEAESGAIDIGVALKEIESATAGLAAAGDLVTAREDFFALTKPMARYRKHVGADGTVVVYCSMEKKAWIQPEGEIGNPYLGQEMPKCGEIVGE
jgi:hypothetical protein